MYITSLASANKILESHSRSQKPRGEYRLDNMIGLMDYLHNPQDNYKIIHVAGTSGKTSTCYYIASLLIQMGYKVGLTVSPHVEKVSERAQINLNPLSDDNYCRELSIFLDIIKGRQFLLSYFEVNIAFAYWLFAKHKVDFAVIEVGLGGLLDSTNVVNRPDKVCVITDIGYDHVDILGNSLMSITRQKAGIIHPHNTVFMNSQSNTVTRTVHKICKQNGATLHTIPSQSSVNKKLPPFQRRNFRLAKAVANFIAEQEGKQLNQQKIKIAENTFIPARMEVRSLRDKTIIFDGSHNVQKIQSLTEGIKEQFPRMQCVILFSLGSNKQREAKNILSKLHELSESIVITTFSKTQDEIRQATNSEKLLNICRTVGFKEIKCITDPNKAFDYIQGLNYPIILITGSYFLLNHVRQNSAPNNKSSLSGKYSTL